MRYKIIEIQWDCFYLQVFYIEVLLEEELVVGKYSFNNKTTHSLYALQVYHGLTGLIPESLF